MTTHSYYTTPTATTPGRRSRATVLVALLILAAMIFALRLTHNPTVVIPTPSTRSAPIGSCRACRDEWIAAMQLSRATFAPSPAGRALQHAAPAANLIVMRQLVGVSRVFRDEMLGADQANLGSISLPSGVFESQQDAVGRSEPR
jgi:hypothetical protein